MSEDDIRFKREILGVSILLILGSLFIIYPFLDAIILAVATSYLLRFAHKELNKRIENEFLSTMIIISSVIGLFLIAVFLLLNNFNEIIGSINIFVIDLQQNIEQLITQFNLSESFRAEVNSFMISLSELVRNSLRNTLASIPALLIDLGIFLVTSIYFYKDGAKIEKKLFSVIESFPENEEKIMRSLLRSTDSIFRGVFLTQFIVAGVLAIVTAIGFYLIGLLTTPIPFIGLWAVLVGIAALLPLIAAFMFYGPIGLYYILYGQPLKGTLVLIFGVVFLNILSEVILRPYVGARQMDEHPLIIFTGFLAGPLTLGIKGLILGPLMLILSKEFLLNYSELVSGEPEENRIEDKED
ncbi:MAG: putative PurR-regulated permease PerM [Candidatus Nanohaloarchaea archaeon]|jgi:predicted PurR-regulated permease PerM